MYLGGCHIDDDSACVRVFHRSAEIESRLHCTHEEADDRVLFHLRHGVKFEKYSIVKIASSDTDVLVSSTYHFEQLKYFGLEKLWFIMGKSSNRIILPIREAADVLKSDVVDILPAVHALTGCDTTSKVGSKCAAVQAAETYGYDLLHLFGKSELDDVMIQNAEKFLLRCISQNSVFENFNLLRYDVYSNKKIQFDLEIFHQRVKASSCTYYDLIFNVIYCCMLHTLIKYVLILSNMGSYVVTSS